MMVQINWTRKTWALTNMQIERRFKRAGKWHPFQWEAALHCSTAEGPMPYTVSVVSRLFLNFRLLRCRLVSLTSILKPWDSDSVCCDICLPPFRLHERYLGPLTTRTKRLCTVWCRLPGHFPCHFITVHGHETHGCPQHFGVLTF